MKIMLPGIDILKQRGMYAFESFKCPFAIQLINVLLCQVSNIY